MQRTRIDDKGALGDGRTMLVQVSGKQLIFPRFCACCGMFPQVSLPIAGSERNHRSRTRGWIWHVPYCVFCRRHIRAMDVLQGVGLTLFAIAGVLSFWLSAINLRSAIFPALVVLAASGVACEYLGRQWIWKRRMTNCCGLRRAVAYSGSDGSVHRFAFKSKFYGTEFAWANLHKVVNASPEVASIISSKGGGRHQAGRRLFR